MIYEVAGVYVNKVNTFRLIYSMFALNLGQIAFFVLFYSVLDKKKLTQLKAPDKRTRWDPGDQMEDIMFKLFEIQSCWTLKQLVLVITDQPMVYSLMHILTKHLFGYDLLILCLTYLYRFF